MARTVEFDLAFKDDEFEPVTRLYMTIEDNGDEILSKDFRCIADGNVIEHPLYLTGQILSKKYSQLLKCSLDDRWIVAVPTENSIGIDIRDLQDETVSYLDTPVEVSPEEIVSSLLDFARRYLDHRYETTPDKVCTLTRLEVGIEEAERRLAYQQELGTQAGYQPKLKKAHLKTIVRECKHVDRLTSFVQRTSAIKLFIDDLQSSDDKYAKDWYEELLLYADPEVPSEAAKALAENPDPRAKDALLQTRWKDQAEVVPHAVRALVRIGGDDVRDGLLELIEYSDKEPIRVATVEGLAEFDDEEVQTTLQAIKDDQDESETVRKAARDALTAFDE